MGEISTRSNPSSLADSNACAIGMTPTCPPSGSMTLTSLALIPLLMLIPSNRLGFLGRLGIAISHLLYLWVLPMFQCVSRIAPLFLMHFYDPLASLQSILIYDHIDKIK